jgi:hypothetical protein
VFTGCAISLVLQSLAAYVPTHETGIGLFCSLDFIFLS